MAEIWDNIASCNLTLSADEQTEYMNATGYCTIISKTGKATGKYYIELHCLGVVGENGLFGFSDPSGCSAHVGGSGNSFGFTKSGTFYNSGTATGALTHTFSDNDVICFAIDANTGDIWVRNNNGAWDNSGDPSAGTNASFNLPEIIHLAVSSYEAGNGTNNTYRIESSHVGCQYTPPVGFGYWSNAKHVVSNIIPYGDLTEARIATMLMPYGIRFDIQTITDMPYSIRMAMSLVMYYSDAPILQQIQNMYYGDCPLLKKSVTMKYGELLQLKKITEMEYSILKPLMAITEARYGINGESLQSIMDMQYSLSEYNLLCKTLSMPYMLQSDAMVREVSSTLHIAGVPIKFNQVSVDVNEDSYCITADVALCSIAQYMQIREDDVAVLTCNEITYNLIVDSKKRSRPESAKVLLTVELVSPAVKLSAPRYKPMKEEFDAGLAEDIINTLVGDFAPVDYRIVAFPVLAHTLYANYEDARTVVRKLNQSVGAKLHSNPDGSLRIDASYPVSVPDWATAAPDYYFTDERTFISQDESPVKNSGENKYLVGTQMSSEERTWTEQETISNREVAVLGFQVPWGCDEITGLTHSGGDWVYMPEYMGVVEELYPPLTDANGDYVEPEQVEFVAGFANASRPIYGDLQVEWLRAPLGAITCSEDGKLDAEVKDGKTDGYSLAAIRYKTKYHKWIVRDDIAEDVQYLLWLAEEEV